MKKLIFSTLISVVLFALTSCSSLNVLSRNSEIDTNINGELEYCETRWVIAGTEFKQNSDTLCVSGLNAQVRIKPNFFYSLVHVCSVGIVRPINVCVSCQTESN